jgi:hypothetical protein
MSTKIYNAYKFNGDHKDIIYLCKNLSKLFVDDCIQKINQKESFIIRSVRDKRTRKQRKRKYPLYHIELIDFLNDIIKEGYRHPLNFEASIVVYLHEKNIYMQFFGCEKLIKKDNFKYKDSLEDFHYQNQVDMSNYDEDKEPWNEMSEKRQLELEEDWEKRKEIWNEILGGSAYPVQNGLVYELFSKPTQYLIADEYFKRKLA